MNNSIHLLNIREYLCKFEGVALCDHDCDAFALLHAMYLFTIRETL